MNNDKIRVIQARADNSSEYDLILDRISISNFSEELQLDR